METALIIIRGNAGSGKTTIATALQKEFGEGTLLVSQDTVRRDMLQVRDQEDNLSIELISQIAKYGKGKCEYVIVEGILNTKRYQKMLDALIADFDQKAFVYYFDLPLEETIKRHHLREKITEFGENELRSWWNAEDYLKTAGEVLLTQHLSQKDILTLIYQQVQSEGK